jgi:hypothetical protein
MLKRRFGAVGGVLAVTALAAAVGGCSRTPLLSPEPLHPCVPVDPDRPSTQIVSAEVDIDRSDILFLVDNSNSMFGEIERIRSQLTDVLVPQIYERVSDARLGVAVFSDFGERQVGERSHPYQLLLPVTDRVDDVLDAVERIELEFGGDNPESQLEALYQTATGEGLGVFIEPGPECADDGRAGVCFRSGSFAIVMLFSDAPMRSVLGIMRSGEPSRVEVEGGVMNEPFIPVRREYDETIEALKEFSIRVVGLWSGDVDADGVDDMRRVSRDTGALDEAGQPIVFDIGRNGEQLGAGVIGGLEAITAGSRHEVSLELADADLQDGVDPRALVTGIRALRLEPGDGGTAAGDRFVDVRSGTRVFFELTFDASGLPRTELDQRFPLRVSALASDGTRLSDETVDLVIAAEGEACAGSEPAAAP